MADRISIIDRFGYTERRAIERAAVGGGATYDHKSRQSALEFWKLPWHGELLLVALKHGQLRAVYPADHTDPVPPLRGVRKGRADRRKAHAGRRAQPDTVFNPEDE